jgi:hypothetical protein
VIPDGLELPWLLDRRSRADHVLLSREPHADHAAFRAFLAPVITSLASYNGNAVKHLDC